MNTVYLACPKKDEHLVSVTSICDPFLSRVLLNQIKIFLIVVLEHSATLGYFRCYFLPVLVLLHILQVMNNLLTHTCSDKT